MRQALVSVADKRGLIPLANALVAAGFGIISSAGTARALTAHGITCREVSDLTGFPEVMGGRIKTMHPQIIGGILGRRDQDAEIMERLQIGRIDLVVVNLYPFAQMLAKCPDDHQLLIENIDIGGPTMLRSAAKNHQWVSAVIDPDDYPAVMQSLADGGPDAAMRKQLAAKTFRYIANYDATIANYLSQQQQEGISLQLPYTNHLRYGENPHQQGELHTYDQSTGWGGMHLLQGKALSYNNIVDADTAWSCVSEFDQPACVIVKHATPCGAAVSASPKESYLCAFATDRESAFGGVIALNRECDQATAEAIIASQFAEVIVAPAFDQKALKAWETKPRIRLIVLPSAKSRGQIRSVSGGILWQAGNQAGFDLKNITPVSGTVADMPVAQLAFAWLLVKHVKSNAIVLAHNQQAIGIGSGQTSRIRALRQAFLQAQENGFATQGCVLASDAFFPFADSIAIAAEIGVSWIIQPGGSIRDSEVIQAARDSNIAMVCTSERHFSH